MSETPAAYLPRVRWTAASNVALFGGVLRLETV